MKLEKILTLVGKIDASISILFIYIRNQDGKHIHSLEIIMQMYRYIQAVCIISDSETYFMGAH